LTAELKIVIEGVFGFIKKILFQPSVVRFKVSDLLLFFSSQDLLSAVFLIRREKDDDSKKLFFDFLDFTFDSNFSLTAKQYILS
jgi:hypothetical protein